MPRPKPNPGTIYYIDFKYGGYVDTIKLLILIANYQQVDATIKLAPTAYVYGFTTYSTS